LNDAGHGEVGVVSVNWYESYDGKREPRLARALRTVSKDFAVVRGSERLVRDFDGVHSLPAVYVFDAEGKEVFRLGGDPGPPGRYHLTRAQLARAFANMK
jgi:hypothetical protein